MSLLNKKNQQHVLRQTSERQKEKKNTGKALKDNCIAVDLLYTKNYHISQNAVPSIGNCSKTLHLT